MRRQPHLAHLAGGEPERRDVPAGSGPDACAHSRPKSGPDAGACARSATNPGAVTVANARSGTNTGAVTVADARPASPRPS